MTTAGEIIVGETIRVAGEVEVGRVGIGDGVIVVPGDPDGDVTQAELDAVAARVTALESQPYAFDFLQPLPSTTWLITHPLLGQPDVRVIGTDGRRLYPQRQTYPLPGQLRLDFGSRPVAGTAHLKGM
ncbi:hypothetical protein WY02_03440 [Pseudonocardia sp. AL041005-10]|nr:hypothetical protein [Pseudonocardia sp. AL041005-10]ALE77657.1 hypothetical protein WY02_03440 [Pseudonocardia sp. AL041005-10]